MCFIRHLLISYHSLLLSSADVSLTGWISDYGPQIRPVDDYANPSIIFDRPACVLEVVYQGQLVWVARWIVMVNQPVPIRQIPQPLNVLRINCLI